MRRRDVAEGGVELRRELHIISINKSVVKLAHD